ncbi:MAG: hypothetical protein DRK00_06625 [Thermoprotei archaeon]|nr:MAG: hypothetical protein DRK00_06625 [Thermoprotei archaeon]
MSLRVRARFEGGVLKPLSKLELEEGEEVEVVIRRSAKAVLDRYVGVLGRAEAKELDELAEEAQAQ